MTPVTTRAIVPAAAALPTLLDGKSDYKCNEYYNSEGRTKNETKTRCA